ncbi:hypothetical protein ACH0R4_RS05980 [Bacillus cytotoxicus]|nr:hypothetical protein [Bacillus cereus group sp. BfR-BA-01492]
MRKLMGIVLASIFIFGVYTSIDISEISNDIPIQYGHGKGI